MATNCMIPKLSGRALESGTPVLCFVSGFPDTYNSFDAVASSFKATHHIRTYVMPDYDRSDGLRQYWGYSFSQIVDDLAKNLKEVQDVARGSTVTLCGHDWGSFVCQRFVSKYGGELITRVVYLDVGIMTKADILKEATWKQLLVIAGYQLWVTMCFIIGRLTLTAIGDLFMVLYPWKLLGPCPKEYKLPRHWREVHCWMGYPYFHLHFGKYIFGGPDKKEGDALKFVPEVPALFAYGRKKRIMFHTPGFIKKMDEQVNGGGAHELECGHWVQTQKPDEVSKLIRAFDKGESCKTLTSERVD